MCATSIISTQGFFTGSKAERKRDSPPDFLSTKAGNTFFEQGSAAFEGGRSPSRVVGHQERKLLALESKLAMRTKALAELMGETGGPVTGRPTSTTRGSRATTGSKVGARRNREVRPGVPAGGLPQALVDAFASRLRHPSGGRWQSVSGLPSPSAQGVRPCGRSDSRQNLALLSPVQRQNRTLAQVAQSRLHSPRHPARHPAGPPPHRGLRRALQHRSPPLRHRIHHPAGQASR